MEIWKPVVGFEGRYEVSDHGQIRNTKTRQILRPFTSRNGYVVATLAYTSGRPIKKAVHTLVLEAFVGPRQKEQQTRHLNGVRSDNSLVNLAYGTGVENAADRKRHGTHRFGETHSGAKLCDESVREIRQAAGTLKQLAGQYGVHFSMISLIRQRKIWRHV